jgi:hypothetical protein
VVKDHAEGEQALADGLARLALRRQRAYVVGDVRGRDPVDASVAEHPDGDAVSEPGVLGDVHAALLPAPSGLPQRRRHDGLGRNAKIRDTLGCELTAIQPARMVASRFVANEPPYRILASRPPSRNSTRCRLPPSFVGRTLIQTLATGSHDGCG